MKDQITQIPQIPQGSGIKNKMLHIARTPMCKIQVHKDKKKEMKKRRNYLNHF